MNRFVRLLGAIAFSSCAAVLAIGEGAFAQLNVGQYGVQAGLESEYLQYQLSGQDLTQMRTIPACSVGFGLGCNKTATVLEQLLESQGGASYLELLMRASGGEENFRNFASFYGNNPNLHLIPYASFWRNGSPYIMDGYQYLLGSPVSQTPVQGLGQVTKNFYWAPSLGVGNSQSLRSGLLNLKYSFGRLLFEEIAKIPNPQQQIQSLALPANIKQFYLNNLSGGLSALNTGDENLLKQSILNVLSLPFSTSGGEFGRPNIGIPQEFNGQIAQTLPGDVFVAAPPELPVAETISQDIPSNLEEGVFVQEGSSKRFPIWLIPGGGLAALVLILSLGGDSSSSNRPDTLAAVTPPVSNLPSPMEYPSTPPSGTVVPNYNQVIEIPPTTNIIQKPEEEVKVSEPSIVKPLVLLIILLYVLGHKQRFMQTNA
ncbi:hypothetical protein [Iningainema tapete]|uniref:Uncharacterized protein n=1 Tax=Iningainema tapete BLCC-T55 TaxID=2748662 RepID=A0A8J7BXR8_9CYAN|nr:hypothetical protein [Iningainema tapete]MBD2774242.1 hypothetical protein [Iningainema tapete BLCC-T55]